MVSTEKREGDRVQKRKPALSCVHSVDDSIYGTFVLLSLQRSISNAKILNSIPTGGFPTSVFNGINIFIFPVPRNTTVPAHTHTYIYILSISHIPVANSSHNTHSFLLLHIFNSSIQVLVLVTISRWLVCIYFQYCNFHHIQARAFFDFCSSLYICGFSSFNY